MIEHTLRKPASNITWNPQGKRKRGRPKYTWFRDANAQLLRKGHYWKKLEKTARSLVHWRIAVLLMGQRAQKRKLSESVCVRMRECMGMCVKERNRQFEVRNKDKQTDRQSYRQ